jgi:hypothetical protein
MTTFPLGAVVVNLSSTIARVVAYKGEDLILKSVTRDGRLWGGKWVADRAKTRELTADESARYFSNARMSEIVR